MTATVGSDKGPVIHDNCLNVPNPEQQDANDDGIGDACQKCPWDPGNDEDGDGICGDGPGRPPTATVDNCPRISNAGQENCNADSEVQRAIVTNTTPVLRGDVCDPVPCPRVLHTQASTVARGGSYDPEWGGTFYGRTFMDQVAPRPLPSHVSNASVAQPVDNGSLVTHARFCQNDPGIDWTCRGVPGNFRDNALTDYLSPSAEQNDNRYPWHRVMHDPYPWVRGASWSWPYTAAAMNGAAGLPNARWDYRADAAEWAARDLVPTPPGGSACLNGHVVGEGTCLDGIMWYHADTSAGRTVDRVNGTFVGLHGGDDQLANFYTPWRPDDAFITAFKGYGRYKKLFWWQKLFATSPFDVVQTKTHARPIGLDQERIPQLLHDNGSGQSLDETAMTLKLSKMLGKDIVVAASLEPLAVGSSLDSRIEAAIVSDDGRTVVDTVAATTTSSPSARKSASIR